MFESLVRFYVKYCTLFHVLVLGVQSLVRFYVKYSALFHVLILGAQSLARVFDIVFLRQILWPTLVSVVAGQIFTSNTAAHSMYHSH